MSFVTYFYIFFYFFIMYCKLKLLFCRQEVKSIYQEGPSVHLKMAVRYSKRTNLTICGEKK